MRLRILLLALVLFGCGTEPPTDAPSPSLVISPASADLPLSGTVQFTATLRDPSGRPLPLTGITWSSSDTTIARVGGGALITAAGIGGPVTITAESDGRRAHAILVVTPAGRGRGRGPGHPKNLQRLGPLGVSAANPRYFTDRTGRAVYLTGAHTWMNFQDAGPTDPPAPFDWPAYLDFLQRHHLNVIKLWRWEQAKGSAETANDLWFDPLPYRRTGPGLANDGKPKFDLTQFDPQYFARLRERVLSADQRGIYVSIMLFNGWSIEDKGLGVSNPWPGHPFQRDNNINGIDGDPNGDNQGLETHTLEIPAITALQEAYVRQVIDAVNSLDNVLFEISNESRSGLGAEEWQQHMIDFIKQYEAGKPQQHPVGMTALYPGGSNERLFASGADWIAPNGGIDMSPSADGSKVILDDTDHLCGICGDASWVWKSFTRGRNPMLMDGYDGKFPIVAHYDPADPRWEEIRVNLGYTLTFANRMNLIAMQPREDIASSGYCLANPAGDGTAEYLVYLGSNRSVMVDLTPVRGLVNIEWFNPATGETIAGGTSNVGSVVTFTAPTQGATVLYLRQ